MTVPPLVHFLDEQRRHRRTSALSGALVVLVLAVSGIPLSVFISPAGAGWIGVGAVLLCGVVALSVVGAAAVLYALGWLLQKALVAFPRWVGRLWA